MSSDVNTLMEMGFTENGAKRGLSKTGYRGVQVAMDWLLAHDADPDLNDPVEEPKGYTLNDPPAAAEQGDTTQSNTAASDSGGTASAGDQSEATVGEQTAKSLKCDDCGKILRNIEEAEFHAAKSGHSNFSESTEEKKPMTAEQKAEQVNRLQEKLKTKRQEREAQERQEKVDREKLRRLQGKDMVSAKAKHEELEMKKLAELKRREKQEEKLARQKVRDEIERDKRERAAKFGKASAAKPATSPPPTATAQPPVAAAAAQKEYKDARLQMRLPNGQALSHTFGGKEQLAAVRLYIQMNRTDGDTAPFKLMMSFPKKVYTEEDMEKPLCELGLVPSAVLIVSKTT